MVQDTLIRLASERNTPCVTISFNTHRTHPDSQQDAILLKKLCHEAAERIIARYGKRPVQPILDHLAALPGEIDEHYHLDSFHIFLSNDTREVIRSPWPTNANTVQIDDRFMVAPLIKAWNQQQEYLIVLFSQGGVHLYHALNDAILGEITDGVFPYPATDYYMTAGDNLSDSRLVDNLARGYFNDVDKEILKVQQAIHLPCIVISTADNFNKLLHVADRPSLYAGHAPVDYNHTAPHTLARQAWEVVKQIESAKKREALDELKAAIPRGQVMTDLREIWRAAREGRGDLLFVQDAFRQPVRMLADNTFELVHDSTAPDVVDDITTQIAWDVISRKGRVHFAGMHELGDLAPIVLKTRY